MQADEASLESAKLQLDYARITAPIDGQTGLRLVDPGNLVRATDANGLVLITQLRPPLPCSSPCPRTCCRR